MKNKLWFALLAFCLLTTTGHAENAIISCTATNLLQTYSTSTPSLQANLTNIPARKHLVVINAATTRVCVNTVSNSTTAPTAGNGNEHCLAPATLVVYNEINTNAGLIKKMNVYVRGDQANCTSGFVDIDAY